MDNFIHNTQSSNSVCYSELCMHVPYCMTITKLYTVQYCTRTVDITMPLLQQGCIEAFFNAGYKDQHPGEGV